MSEHPGLLGFLAEACDIKQELGVSVDEAFRIQRERAEQRSQERAALEQAAGESNVIPFRPR